MGARFEDDQLVVEAFPKLFFGKKIRIPYEDIERIEFPMGEEVLFHMKKGKTIQVKDPGVVDYYTGFGDMLKKYRIPYKCICEEIPQMDIETVREKAALAKETALAYANRLLKEKAGPEYTFDAKIVERIIGTTLEFHLLKDGVVQKEADQEENIDGEPVFDEMDVAFLAEWDPALERATYTLTEEADDTAACEEYVKSCVLDRVSDYIEQ